MMDEAPTNEQPWTTGWILWLKKVSLRLGGWKKTQTATLTYDFALTASLNQWSTTLTVTGVRVGDPAIVTPETPTDGIIYQAVVTANDTVTLYAYNVSGASVNPTSTTFRVIVFQQ